MPTYVVRVWMPDRPGALGAVASRIGAVRGDVVGIDILERGAGQAIDELVVQLEDEALVPLLVDEIAQVDGVDVEDVRQQSGQADPRLDALETAAVLVGQSSLDGLLEALVDHARKDFGADWAAIVDPPGPALLAQAGDPPPPAWLSAFVTGSRSSVDLSAGQCGPEDIASADISSSSAALVVGRAGRPFRARERRQVTALTWIADARWAELAEGSPRRAQPAVRGPALSALES
ncbi:MAG: ACT domain-containing protein [Acidimicrobiales bacterium]